MKVTFVPTKVKDEIALTHKRQCYLWSNGCHGTYAKTFRLIFEPHLGVDRKIDGISVRSLQLFIPDLSRVAVPTSFTSWILGGYFERTLSSTASPTVLSSISSCQLETGYWEARTFYEVFQGISWSVDPTNCVATTALSRKSI